jgi:hypothetical protein
VAGGQLPIGMVMRMMHSTRIANLSEVRAWRLADASGSIGVRFDPAGNRDMTVRAAPSGIPAAPGQNQRLLARHAPARRDRP